MISYLTEAPENLIKFKLGVFFAEGAIRASNLSNLTVDVKLLKAIKALSKVNGSKNVHVDEINWEGAIHMPNGEIARFSVSPDTGEVDLSIRFSKAINLQGKPSDVVKDLTKFSKM